MVLGTTSSCAGRPYIRNDKLGSQVGRTRLGTWVGSSRYLLVLYYGVRPKVTLYLKYFVSDLSTFSVSLSSASASELLQYSP